MENLSNGLSTTTEVEARIKRTGNRILRVESSTHEGIDIMTFQDGSQAAVTQDDAPYFMNHKELWKGGPTA